ncbi:MAG: hypothetical protein H6578_06060 [Chitinophagales bacterium]|nr:hypothetical protein [Chitinophagales bacterium]
MKLFYILILFFFSFCSIQAQNKAKLIAPLHSHNDYLKDKPLWDALGNGAHSIEIDVFAYGNELKIAHIKFALKYRDNLTDFYLKPLLNLVMQDGYFYDNIPLILMIDFKNNRDTSLNLLLQKIEPYKDYFTFYHNDSVYNRPLQLLISGGGFSYDAVKNMDSIYVFLDGSVHNCESDFPDKLVPRGSANYNSNFKWKGKGEMPEDELNKLREMISKAKSCGKELRFYAMPHNENIWTKFLDEGVYWMNIDNNYHFKRFYEKYLNK